MMVAIVLRPERNSLSKDFYVCQTRRAEAFGDSAMERGRSVLPHTLDTGIANPKTQPHGAFGRVSLR